MDKIRRNERMSAMMKILAAKPNRIFTLSYFCDLFGSAKSTMSEDIDILRDVVAHFGLGELETVTGAAGGVRYRTKVRRPEARQVHRRPLPAAERRRARSAGGFLYYSDILSTPEIVTRMGEIMATEYYAAAPDFVLTMETKGIPVAFATANALGVPLVIARRSSKVYEGSAVNINYVSGSSGHIETMSLSRRAVQEGQKCLIVDDFLKGGGTAKGMVDLMREFNVEVIGMTFVMSTAKPVKKRVMGEKSLMVMDIDQEHETVLVKPAFWLNGDA